jgi:hypothetical protein
MEAMSSLPPQSKQDRFWRGCRLFPAATRDDAILCGRYALQHDGSLWAERKCERLEKIIDSALRPRQALHAGGMLPARIVEEKARIAARGDRASDG